VTGSLSINANGGTLVACGVARGYPLFAWLVEQAVGVAKKRLKSGDCDHLNLAVPAVFAMCHHMFNVEHSHAVVMITLG
jgi:hypothetical protein